MDRTRTQLPRTVRARTLFAMEDWSPCPTCCQRPEPEPDMSSTAGIRAQHAANGPNPAPVFRNGRKPRPVCAGRPKPEFGAYSRAGSSPGIARWMKAEPRFFEWAEPVLGARTDAASRRAHCGMRQGDELSTRGMPYASSKREKRSGSLRSSKPKRMMCAPVTLRRDSR